MSKTKTFFKFTKCFDEIFSVLVYKHQLCTPASKNTMHVNSTFMLIVSAMLWQFNLIVLKYFHLIEFFSTINKAANDIFINKVRQFPFKFKQSKNEVWGLFLWNLCFHWACCENHYLIRHLHCFGILSRKLRKCFSQIRKQLLTD